VVVAISIGAAIGYIGEALTSYLISSDIVNASVLLRGARRGSGMSQRELARRVGLTQASVSRIERGVVSPTVATLDRLLRECGWEVDAVRRHGEGVDRTLIQERLRLKPGGRIREGEIEWEEIDALRRAAQRGRQRRSRSPDSSNAGAA
jgi:transcriptional regulator with XRE-family HTH domain